MSVYNEFFVAIPYHGRHYTSVGEDMQDYPYPYTINDPTDVGSTRYPTNDYPDEAFTHGANSYIIFSIDEQSGWVSRNSVENGTAWLDDSNETWNLADQSTLPSRTHVWIPNGATNTYTVPSGSPYIGGLVEEAGTYTVYIFEDYSTINPQPSETTYYYTVKVVDLGGNPVSGATVSVYSDNRLHTQIGYATENGNTGIYTYTRTSTRNVTLYIDAKKTDYTYASGSMYVSVSGKTSPYDAEANAPTITLKRASNPYYYVIAVKDNVGNPISGIKFRVYTNFNYSTPYTNGNYKYHVNNLGSSQYVLEDVRDIIVDLNPDLMLEDITASSTLASLDVPLIDLKTQVEQKFSISNVNINGISTVSSLVSYIQQNSTAERYISLFQTGTDGPNGTIVLNMGTFTSEPSTSVYVKGVYLPSNYRWNGNSYGIVSATPSTSTPNKTFYVYSNQYTTTYYHNFTVYDGNTGELVTDADVTFKNGVEILYEDATDYTGKVNYHDYYQNLNVEISKDGYNTLSFQSTGSTTASSNTNKTLTPKNSIRVVYKGTNEGVEGETVTIFRYGEGSRIVITTVVTNENGYVKTLPSEYFLPENDLQALVRNIIRPIGSVLNKNIIIEVPFDEGSDIDEEYAFSDFNKLSINSIKKAVNNGNLEIKKKATSNKVTYNSNDFRINIQDPDTVTIYDIFSSVPVMMFDNKKDVIGSVDIALKQDINTLRLKGINRYSGNYNPIFKDILFYNNYITEDKVDLPYSNISFDTSYKDKYGRFGIINNLWFHKVNDNKDIEIIDTLTPYYPLMGQYALDSRDYNIFESSWDINHFTRQTDIEHSELCQNIVSMKEGLCMFGSKYLNVPERIEITGFKMGDDPNWKGDWNDDWIVNTEGCPGEMMFKELNDNSVDFYFFFKKRIIRYFYEKLKDEFEKYISDESTFGKPGVEDDIKEYVEKNILRLYKLEKVRMYVRRTKRGQHNSKIENDYTKYLEYFPDDKTDELHPLTTDDLGFFKSHGFIEINTMTMTKMNRDDFDRKIVYNLRNGAQEDFGFSFILKKI